jgi:hypothetical protein
MPMPGIRSEPRWQPEACRISLPPRAELKATPSADWAISGQLGKSGGDANRPVVGTLPSGCVAPAGLSAMPASLARATTRGAAVVIAASRSMTASEQTVPNTGVNRGET